MFCGYWSCFIMFSNLCVSFRLLYVKTTQPDLFYYLNTPIFSPLFCSLPLNLIHLSLHSDQIDSARAWLHFYENCIFSFLPNVQLWGEHVESWVRWAVFFQVIFLTSFYYSTYQISPSKYTDSYLSLYGCCCMGYLIISEQIVNSILLFYFRFRKNIA